MGSSAGGRAARALGAALGASCLAPLGLLLLLSVAGRWPFPDLWPAFLRGDRWGELVSGESPLAGSLGLSLLVSGTVAAVSTTLGAVTARSVAYHPKGGWLLLLAYLPFSLSPVTLGACLLFLWIKLGLAATLPGVILAQTIFAYGFSVVFWSAFWTPKIRAMETLVLALGGGPGDFYSRILLPLARGPLALCASQTFLISWFQYGLTLLVGAGKFETLPLKVYDYVGEANPGYAAVASCLLILPPALVLWANRRILLKAV